MADKIKISQLPELQDIDGFYTIGTKTVDGAPVSYKVNLTILKQAVAGATAAAAAASAQASAASTAASQANTAAQQAQTTANGKMPKVASAVINNVATFDDNGVVKDSGRAISEFITSSVNNLLNYYKKSETYTQAEVNALIAAINQFHYEIVATLPATGAGNALYLLGPIGTGSDKYEEYVYSNSAWTKIGDTSIDLSNYVTLTALNTALANYRTAALQDVIDATKYVKPTGGIPETDLANGVKKFHVLEKGEGENSIIQPATEPNKAISNGCVAIGSDNFTGVLGFYYKSIDFTNKAIYLSRTQVEEAPTSGASSTEDVVTGYVVGDILSIVNLNKYNRKCTITGVNGSVVTVNELPFSSINVVEELENDDFCVFVDGKDVPDEAKTGGYVANIGENATAIGSGNTVAKDGFAVGRDNEVFGNYGAAIGRQNKANYGAIAEGYQNEANGHHSHAEGSHTEASGENAHSEGYSTKASGGYGSHAEGNQTIASGNSAHAEGRKTTASAKAAHAEGELTEAIGDYSHAEGYKTETSVNGEHAEGLYNKTENGGTDSTSTIHSVGIGTATNNRKNALQIQKSGDVYIIGIGGFDGTNRSSSQKVQTVLDNKVDKITGKGLSQNDYTDTDKNKVATAVQPAALDAEALARQNADTALGGRMTTAEGTLTNHGGRLTTAEGDIDTIEGKVPAQATAENQLADKAFVNSSINSVTAYYITSNVGGDAFATKAALLAGPYYNQGELRTPTRNDYASVLADETKDGAQTRYVYDGAVWAYQYKVNDKPFTSAQNAAINSGATSEIINSVAGKYVKPVTGIPASDMSAEVQTSLGKADTALQEHQSLAAYRTSALQDAIDAGKASKPSSEVFSVSSWSDLASADPFTKQATLTAQHTIGANTIVELINNNAVAFANYGFQIGAVSGQTITLYAIEAPTSAVNITINFTD